MQSQISKVVRIVISMLLMTGTAFGADPVLQQNVTHESPTIKPNQDPGLQPPVVVQADPTGAFMAPKPVAPAEVPQTNGTPAPSTHQSFNLTDGSRFSYSAQNQTGEKVDGATVSKYANVLIVSTEVVTCPADPFSRAACRILVSPYAIPEGQEAVGNYITKQKEGSLIITTTHLIIGTLVSKTQKISLQEGGIFTYDLLNHTGTLIRTDGKKIPYYDVQIYTTSVATCPSNPMMLRACQFTRTDLPPDVNVIGTYQMHITADGLITTTTYAVTGLLAPALIGPPLH